MRNIFLIMMFLFSTGCSMVLSYFPPTQKYIKYDARRKEFPVRPIKLYVSPYDCDDRSNPDTYGSFTEGLMDYLKSNSGYNIISAQDIPEKFMYTLKLSSIFWNFWDPRYGYDNNESANFKLFHSLCLNKEDNKDFYLMTIFVWLSYPYDYCQDKTSPYRYYRGGAKQQFYMGASYIEVEYFLSDPVTQRLIWRGIKHIERKIRKDLVSSCKTGYSYEESSSWYFREDEDEFFKRVYSIVMKSLPRVHDGKFIIADSSDDGSSGRHVYQMYDGQAAGADKAAWLYYPWGRGIDVVDGDNIDYSMNLDGRIFKPVEVLPGSHTIVVQTRNGRGSLLSKYVSVDAQAGHTYFLHKKDGGSGDMVVEDMGSFGPAADDGDRRATLISQPRKAMRVCSEDGCSKSASHELKPGRYFVSVDGYNAYIAAQAGHSYILESKPAGKGAAEVSLKDNTDGTVFKVFKE